MPARSDPRAAYAQRLEARRARVAELERRSRRIADARLACFLAIAAAAWVSFGMRAVGPWALAVPGAIFLGLVVWHDRALRAQRRAERAVTFYERGLARIEDRWIGQGGDPGARFQDPQHPYAADLDLFGPGSLFELLSLARTAAGEATLAAWLRSPADAGEIRARQASVEALRERLELREDLAVLGADVRAGLDAERLAAWGERQVDPLPRWAPPLALALAAVALVAAAGWGWLDWGPAPFVVAVAVGYALRRWLRPAMEQATEAVGRAGSDLALLAELVARVEREALEGARLGALREALHGGGEPASAAIRGLRSRVNLHEARANQFFLPIAAVLLWDVQTSSAIATWRRRFGPKLRGWLQALGELEALSSLAAYAYEHPEDPFPEIVDGAVCEGEALGHPLIPAATCVRNDLALAGGRRLLLVSGSNMSGKSTFLRTVGINAVLGLAGAPVRARRLRLSPVRLGATLRIQDSLQQGASRFYAEITRLRQLLDLASGDRPLLFLLDEILHGTNSHDRLIGAEAVIRALLDRGALGLVTTHDLALARLVDALGPLAANAHFADTVVEGKLVFDYRKREGVVQQSNAIALMRAVGLPV